MNFKILFFFLFASVISSCGVKQAPLRPADTLIPSYVEEFEKDPTHTILPSPPPPAQP